MRPLEVGGGNWPFLKSHSRSERGKNTPAMGTRLFPGGRGGTTLAKGTRAIPGWTRRNRPCAGNTGYSRVDEAEPPLRREHGLFPNGRGGTTPAKGTRAIPGWMRRNHPCEGNTCHSRMDEAKPLLPREHFPGRCGEGQSGMTNAGSLGRILSCSLCSALWASELPRRAASRYSLAASAGVTGTPLPVS